MFNHRAAIVASDRTTAIAGLRQVQAGPAAGDGRIAFAFTGQGQQPVGFARGLHAASPSFAAALDLCRADLAELGCDIDRFLFGEDHSTLRDAFGETENAQPTLFAFAYAVAEMLEAWGVAPAALIGHSLGEFVALCRAGVLDRRQALALVVARGRAMQGLREGHMLAVAASAAQVEPYLADAAIGAHNGPAQTVVAGTPAAVARVAQRLGRAGINSRMLAGRRAFHTSEMEPAVKAIVAAAERVDLKPPLLPVASNLTGRFFPAGHAPEPAYFAQQAASPVRFADGVGTLVESGCRLFIEIGAGTALTGLIRANAGGMPLVGAPVMPDPTAGDPVEQVLRAVAALWTAGAAVDWQRVDVLAQGGMISLPPYPFARTRCWVDSPLAAADALPSSKPHVPADPSIDGAPGVAAIWAACLGQPHVALDADYHRLGGDSLTAVRIAERLTDRFGVALMPSDLLTAGSPQLMADLISRRRASGVTEAGVVIRARDPDPDGELLVLFHAIGGTAHLYGELLSALPPEQSVWLVQALPFAGSQPQPDTIEAAAAFDLEALALNPHRPVHFAGASFGGFLAIEAARQWRAKGGLPASVIMLDSPAPGHFQITRADDNSELLAFMALLIGGPVAAEHVRRLEPVQQRRHIADIIAEYIPGIAGECAAGLHRRPAEQCESDERIPPGAVRRSAGIGPGRRDPGPWPATIPGEGLGKAYPRPDVGRDGRRRPHLDAAGTVCRGDGRSHRARHGQRFRRPPAVSESGVVTGRWLVSLGEAQAAAFDLVCLPWGGGGAIGYRDLQAHQPADISLWAVAPPGRGPRLLDEPERHFDRWIEAIGAEVQQLPKSSHPARAQLRFDSGVRAGLVVARSWAQSRSAGVRLVKALPWATLEGGITRRCGGRRADRLDAAPRWRPLRYPGQHGNGGAHSATAPRRHPSGCRVRGAQRSAGGAVAGVCRP